jgi:hypothetical protein
MLVWVVTRDYEDGYSAVAGVFEDYDEAICWAEEQEKKEKGKSWLRYKYFVQGADFHEHGIFQELESGNDAGNTKTKN